MGDVFNYIRDNKIVLYILIGIAFYFVLKIIFSIIAFYWKAGYESRKKKREERKKERLKWKYAKVNVNNPLLKRIASNRFIICMGSLGKGKSITMNLITHFLVKLREKENKKNKRYNKVMKPEYFTNEQELQKNELLPVYSNLDFKDRETDFKSQELLKYITLSKKAVQKCVFAIDEVSSLFGKDLYYDTETRNSAVVGEMEELFKKGRHYLDCHFIGTEQDGADIYIGFRKNGYALITCMGTVVKISKKGKFVRRLKNICNLIMPGIVTVNYARVMRQQLFTGDKIRTIFKMLLPSYFLLAKEYYTRKQLISNGIKEKYQQYQTRFQFDTGEYYIRYTNADIYAYDTRAFQYEYERLFTNNGERKRING
ncbi:MAG: hypothetical protein IJZ29_04300 [Clostridia bacterium]|nr:hypothetical protein [Clostridia bacterium]